MSRLVSAFRFYPFLSMEKIIRIDQEFKDLIPPLTQEEFDGLGQNILQHGCLDALKVWREESILIDGHNRHAICQKHGLPFDVVELSFLSRNEAYNWIIDNQLSRRNITPEQASYLRGKRYLSEKKEIGENQYTMRVDQNDPPTTTAEKLAEEFKVSAPTIKRDAKFAEAVDLIAEVAPEQKGAILKGESEFTKQEIQSFSTIPTQATQEVTQAAILIDEGELQRRIDERAKELTHQRFIELESKYKKPHVSNNSGNNEWYTPQEYLDAARKVLGQIDLDPASSPIANRLVNASQIFTEEMNGLDQAWRGRVWMNPPYASDLIKGFCEKFAACFESGDVSEGVVLVNNATETSWFARLVDVASAVVFTRGRVRFLNPNGDPVGAPLQGQAILYAGNSPEKFLQEFSDFGWGARL